MKLKKLTASNAGMWSACPAWVQMCDRFPAKPRDEADRLEGLKAHAIARQMIAGQLYDESDPAMVRHCKAYFNDFLAHRPQGTRFLGPEKRIECEVTRREAFVDLYAISDTKLVVWEFKYGHRPVSPIRNPQLTLYAWELAADRSFDFEIEFRVFQPRCYDGKPAARPWSTTKGVMSQTHRRLKAKAESAESDSPIAWPGFHCRSCPGIHACETARKSEFYLIEEPLSLQDPDGPALACELAIIQETVEYLKIRAAGIEEHALSTGLYLPGYELKTGRGMRKIKGDITLIADLYGVKPFKEVPLTPNQLIEAGIPEEVIQPLMEHIPGKKKLKAVDINAAKEMFGNGTD